jgi:hypothetical protein
MIEAPTGFDDTEEYVLNIQDRVINSKNYKRYIIKEGI